MYKFVTLCALISAAAAAAVSPITYVSGTPVAYSSPYFGQSVYSTPVFTKSYVDASVNAVSKTYVAEPDSVRYTEQVHNNPSEYYYTSPVFGKSVYAAAPAANYVSGPVAYSAPGVYNW